MIKAQDLRIGTHVAWYIEDKYIVLGFNDYKHDVVL